MDRDDFRKHLDKATAAALSVARRMVFQPLPDAVRYLVYTNQSYDGNRLMGDEEVYPHEKVRADAVVLPVDADAVVAHLWRNAKVPEWVDMNVESTDGQFTYLRLRCCGRFTATEECLYHIPEGYPPFHVHSPPVPPRWQQGEKFDLYWRQKRRAMGDTR